MGFLAAIIQDTLQTLYEIFGISLVVAGLFMFAYLYCREKGVREGIRNWTEGIRTDPAFRKMFLLAFYTAMILNKTLFCRKIWHEPFKNVIGTWGFYEHGALYTENIENIILFLPFLALLMWALQDTLWKKREMTRKNYYRLAFIISFASSFFIEMLQLFLKVGAIQLSDLAFNTLGGLLGAAVYWNWYHRKRRKEGKEKEEEKKEDIKEQT